MLAIAGGILIAAAVLYAIYVSWYGLLAAEEEPPSVTTGPRKRGDRIPDLMNGPLSTGSIPIRPRHSRSGRERDEGMTLWRFCLYVVTAGLNGNRFQRD